MSSIEELNQTKEQLRSKIVNYIRLRLGDGLVDVELDPEHYTTAIDQAIMVYRQRAQNSTEESYAFLDLYGEQQEYTLPSEILQVRQIFRRGIGSVTGTTASQFEPFASGYLNTYMLVAGRVGGLVNYELFTQYQELAMRMFGGHMNYTYNPVSKKLTIVRKIPSNEGYIDGSTQPISETVLLWVFNYKPEITLLQDYMIFPWIQEYAYAVAKHSLGEAREKFATIVGPQGGTTLNGAALKSEGQATMDKLIEDLKMFVDGSQPYGFIFG
jgi:hypothetical protein